MLWSRTRSAALTWMVWTALASPSAAQETGPSRQAALPGASQAQELLVAAYPELSDRRIAWRLARDGQALIVEAREATPPVLADIQAKGEAGVLTPEAAPTVETRETPLVRARIERDTEGALTTMQIDGTLPRPPAFTAAQASTAPVEASRAAGAMFDPGDPANSVGLLSERLMGILSLTEAAAPTFQNPPDADQEALTWVVDITSDTKNAARSYRLTFEAVEGRLVSIVRR